MFTRGDLFALQIIPAVLVLSGRYEAFTGIFQQ